MERTGETLTDRVAALVAARRAVGLAAHHRTDPDDRAPLPATGPGPLEELGEAVEAFDVAWSRLRGAIRRAVEAGR